MPLDCPKGVALGGELRDGMFLPGLYSQRVEPHSYSPDSLSPLRRLDLDIGHHFLWIAPSCCRLTAPVLAQPLSFASALVVGITQRMLPASNPRLHSLRCRLGFVLFGFMSFRGRTASEAQMTSAGVTVLRELPAACPLLITGARSCP